MENDLQLDQNELKIDSFEILSRFIDLCKNHSRNSPFKISLSCSADITAAVYYYRKYPKVDNFISECLNGNCDYLQLKWLRSTWNAFSKMNDFELSELVINQITLVANLEEEQ
ncbi:MAG: hypothetical protein HYY52_04360 [Candidatus Melainabacteria bacterium]|nr:hypothetical protein [Candidatus Melainabacteria bacterium]